MAKNVELLDNGNEILYPRTVTEQVAVTANQNLKEKIKEMDASIESVTNEVKDARTNGNTNITYNNLKTRLDDEYKKLNNEIEKTNIQLSYINNYSILKYGGSYDGVSDNVDAFNLAKSKNIEVYFPQNETRNAIYYFANTVDFSNVVITSDFGVTISLPTTNYISFKGGVFGNPINIISRDRNNTGKLDGNYMPSYLTSVDTNINKAIKEIKPILVDGCQKILHDFETSYSSTLGSGVDFNSSICKFNKISDNNGYKVDTLRLTDNAKVGSEYKATIQVNTTDNNPSNYISGCIISGDTNKCMALVTDAVALFVQNGNERGHYLNPHVGKMLSHQYNNSQNTLFNISAKKISKQVAEFYINGLYLFSYDLGEEIKNVDIGFGYSMISNSDQYLYNPVEIIREETNYGSPLHIAVFGDSITFGEGLDMSWTNLLEKNLIGKYGVNGIKIDNFAVSGHTASEQLAVMKNDQNPKYDFVLIFVGTNDILRNVDGFEFRNTINEMIQIAKSKVINKKCVVCASPYVWTTRHDFGVNVASNNGGRHRSIIQRLVAEHGVSFADVESEMGEIYSDTSLFILRDNLHPTIQGNSAICSAFLIQLLYLLKTKQIRRDSW